ncbi:hypothetical protein D9M71_388860 [compost metagenome]
MAIVRQEAQACLDLGNFRLGEIIRTTRAQCGTLGFQGVATHEVQRNLLIVHFGTNHTALHFPSAVTQRGRSGRFRDTQLVGNHDGLVQLLYSVLPTYLQLLA